MSKKQKIALIFIGLLAIALLFAPIAMSNVAQPTQLASHLIWSGGYLWSGGFLWSGGYLWSGGFLWSG